MTWTIESTTIPVPSKCRIACRANKEEMPVSGDYPAQTVDGLKLTAHLGHSMAVAAGHYVSPDIFSYEEKNKMRMIIGDLYGR